MRVLTEDFWVSGLIRCSPVTLRHSANRSKVATLTSIRRFPTPYRSCRPWTSSPAWALLDWVDLKVSRQIVIWGRSESLRVLDVPGALSHLQPADDLQACVSFEVADRVVDSEQPLRVTARAENGAVEILDSQQKDPLRCDIKTFTQLFSGGLCVTQARGMNRLDGGNAEMAAACDALLHGRMPYRSGAEAG